MDLSSGCERPGARDAAERGVELLYDVCGVHMEMREIRERHSAGGTDARDRRRYLMYWQALALRRSPGRRPWLPPEFDGVLTERARLLREIRDECTRQEVDAIFVAPEDEAPSQGAGSPVPR